MLRRVFAIALCGAVLIIASAGWAIAATREVNIQGNAYSPQAASVKHGDTVMWHNHDSVKHTVTSNDGGPLDSGNFGQGQAYSFTFSNAGTYSYYCEVHPNMKGSVTVQAAQAAATPAPKPDPTSAPQKAPAAKASPPAATAKPASVAPTSQPRPVAVPAPKADVVATATPKPKTEAPEPIAEAMAAPVPVTESIAAPQPTASNETIDPLLILAAITAGVLIFALLALGRPRPDREPTPPTARPNPKPKPPTKKETKQDEAILTIEIPVGIPGRKAPTGNGNGKRRSTSPPPTKLPAGAGR